MVKEKDPWVKRTTITGTSGKPYTVGLKRDGSYGCSCPAWIFSKVRPRPDCQHILRVKLEDTTHPAPSVRTKSNPEKEEISRSITFED